MSTVLESITALLAASTPPAFATQFTAAPGDLRIKVAGAGRIALPVSAATARRLCQAARLARHGYKDQTRLDRKVRDTWEIGREQISIDAARWKPTLTASLHKVHAALGLPAGQRLKAQLHNLLMYAPGQFFLPHRDSEKTPGMVGTLVVTLPSACTGGELLIEHHGERKTFGASAKDLTLIAFYADCCHEIVPVRKGHRAALTYNLVLTGDPAEVPVPDTAATLARKIRSHFDTPRPQWSARHPGQPPERLVYLLDHQYTQAGLGWNRLKGMDTASAAALRAAAQQLDCEVCLALVDVHEVWMCEDPYEGYGDRLFGHDGEDEENPYDLGEPYEDPLYEDMDDGERPRRHEPTPADELELTELLDSDIELRHWVGAGAPPHPLAPAVTAEELCYTKPSSELEPFSSEHEGYTGNEGSTVERWYHRAAVVLWPRDRTFKVRARGEPRWGLQQIASRLKARAGLAAAQETARNLLSIWSGIIPADDRAFLLGASLPLAVQLEDPKLAAGLLQPFALTQLPARSAERFAEVAGAYGEDFCLRLLRAWKKQPEVHDPLEPGDKRLAWLGTTLAPLCQALSVHSPTARRVARHILSEQWDFLRKELKSIDQAPPSRVRGMWLVALDRSLLGLLEGACAAGDRNLLRQILDALRTGPLPPESAALPLLRAAGLLLQALQDPRPLPARRGPGAPRVAACSLRPRPHPPGHRLPRSARDSHDPAHRAAPGPGAGEDPGNP
jgi:hypothetical protein